MKRFSILLLAVLSVPVAHAQSRAGTTAATFLTLGTGARGSSLGHAYTSIATGPDALFWNPGGASIAYQGRYRGGAFFTHHNWLADIDYNAAAVVVPAGGSGVLGLSIASVDYGRMDVRTVTAPEGTGETFDAGDMSIGLTYATPLTPQFHFGGTAKYVTQRIRDMSASTFAFDFGFVLATDYLNGMRIAASIMNFGGKMQMDGINSESNIDIAPNNEGTSESIPVRIRMDRWDLPIAFKFGVAIPVVKTGNIEVLALADANQTNDNNLNSDFGGQFRYATNTYSFDARIGYKDAFLEDNVDSHLSYGVGLDVEVSGVRFGFDYGYIPFDLLENVQMFDFRVHF
ncbi:MAG: PorV/PorQ family protein [Rhodothermales bacterium]|nr:PorV/PorQ family protein [Rhodothermales bacterium]